MALPAAVNFKPIFLMRYFLEMAYNGKNYHGWQIQDNAHSVQAELNAALQRLFGHPVGTIASGRTDTGVHAEQQYVQVDMNSDLHADHLFRLNRILPFDIVVHRILAVQPGAHVRFDACSRTYEYRICKTKNPFIRDTSYYFSKSLHLEKMNLAASLLKNYEDFECFSKVKTEVGHFRCTVSASFWKEEKGMLIFTISANRFLRGMVRAIVGTMLEIGLERKGLDDLDKIITGKNRKMAGRSAPPQGLFLTRIDYPENIWMHA
jgi:tRNA pseudouridine38-40 synthase